MAWEKIAKCERQLAAAEDGKPAIRRALTGRRTQLASFSNGRAARRALC